MGIHSQGSQDSLFVSALFSFSALICNKRQSFNPQLQQVALYETQVSKDNQKIREAIRMQRQHKLREILGCPHLLSDFAAKQDLEDLQNLTLEVHRTNAVRDRIKTGFSEDVAGVYPYELSKRYQ